MIATRSRESSTVRGSLQNVRSLKLICLYVFIAIPFCVASCAPSRTTTRAGDSYQGSAHVQLKKAFTGTVGELCEICVKDASGGPFGIILLVMGIEDVPIRVKSGQHAIVDLVTAIARQYKLEVFLHANCYMLTCINKPIMIPAVQVFPHCSDVRFLANPPRPEDLPLSMRFVLKTLYKAECRMMHKNRSLSNWLISWMWLGNFSKSIRPSDIPGRPKKFTAYGRGLRYLDMIQLFAGLAGYSVTLSPTAPIVTVIPTKVP